ncbi:hypothetical protein [Poseidonocella sp. HB161398]|uniref:hypothetical protein n=1 Tax=Poseidonocella sp. HB161398 TaxID=2320855 RepID=UPI001980298E|nr:hypothetical protein [Poseidonocella sp. HB161398]
MAVAGIAAIGAADLAFGDDISAIWTGLREKFEALPGWVKLMATGIANALLAAIAPFKMLIDLVRQAEGAFAWLYDKVVGNSWVPDLVEEVGHHFSLLDGNMVKPTEAATGAANDAFKGLADDVSGSLTMLAREGDLTWRGFLGSMEDAAQRQVDSIIGTAFDRLTAAGADALSSAFSGGLSGGGAGAGGGGAWGWVRGLLGFNTGGAFTVRGRAGVDRNVAVVRLSEGEQVEVTRRGGGGSAVNLTMNISTPDVEGFRRSRSQIAAEMRRGLALAERAS